MMAKEQLQRTKTITAGTTKMKTTTKRKNFVRGDGSSRKCTADVTKSKIYMPRASNDSNSIPFPFKNLDILGFPSSIMCG